MADPQPLDGNITRQASRAPLKFRLHAKSSNVRVAKAVVLVAALVGNPDEIHSNTSQA